VDNFILGVVVGVMINLVTALFSRRLALKILPCLIFYIFLHGVYVVFTVTEWGKTFVMVPRGWPYYIAMAILTLLVWKCIAYGVHTLDRVTRQEIPKQQEERRPSPQQLAQIEGPRLVMTPLTISRRIPFDLQPPVSTEVSPDQETLSYFALLKVTNEPESLNTEAIAHDLYASIYFYTPDWKRVLLSPDCVWVSLTHTSGDPDHIGDLSAYVDSIPPYTTGRYLGIAIAESHFPVGEEKGGASMHCTALTPTSRLYERWINTEHFLYELERHKEWIDGGGNTSNESGEPEEHLLDLRVSVTIRCRGFQSTSHFILEDLGDGEGLWFVPTTPPPFLKSSQQ
jgi:hypothetical protein